MCEVESRSWPEVVRFYRDLLSHHGWKIEPMLQVVEQIANSQFAAGLFPYTSMFTLCIARRRDPRMFHEELRITFDPTGNEFQFEYWSDPSMKPGPWKRKCRAADAFPTLERLLLKRLRWFIRIGNTEPQK
jgi:hypothetical protein